MSHPDPEFDEYMDQQEACDHYPTPDAEGHFWAKLMTPHNMPEGEDWASWDWEVVRVFDGSPTETKDLRAFVGGIPVTQPLDAFEWGPRVPNFQTEGT